jgi:hypothetical protein
VTKRVAAVNDRGGRATALIEHDMDDNQLVGKCRRGVHGTYGLVETRSADRII